MRRGLLIAIAICVYFFGVIAPKAQITGQIGEGGPGFQIVGNVGGASSASYTGPGDIVSSASAWFSCSFAYSSAYAASNGKMCNIRRASDNETCDILAASTGGPGLTANCSGSDNNETLATFLASTTAASAEGYDQSGNSVNVTQGTTASQPVVTLNCLGTANCMASTGSMTLFETGFTASAPISVSAVIDCTGTGTSNSFLGLGTGSTALVANCSLGASSTVSTSNGGATGTAAQGVWHSIEGDWLSSGTPFINIDGVATTGTAASPNFSNIVLFAFHTGGGSVGNMPEVGIWPIAFSPTQYAALCKNKQSRYGASNFGAAC